jgi:outer membrane protein insertion porin family
MFKFFSKLVINYIFLISLAFSEVISDFQINGNKRLSDNSVILFSGVKLGEDLNKNDLNEILKNLYLTGFFENISINIIDQKLFIDVVENPIIETIEYNGIKNNSLIELISDKISLKKRASFNEEILLKDLSIFENVLKQNGYYFSKINVSKLLNSELNTIRLSFDVDLGEKAKIKRIKFIGNKIFKDKDLKSAIASEEHKFWKFISNSVYLNENIIQLDKRLLNNYYLNSGYRNVKITDSFVQLDNKGEFDLIFNIDAGSKFYFNKFDLDLPLSYEKNDFQALEKTFEKALNNDYSLNAIEKILTDIENIASARLYDFIDAKIEETIIDGNKINVKIKVIESEPYFVEKINFFGNFTTYEEVLRNKLSLDEGDPLNNVLLTKSIDNIKGSRLFKNVNYQIEKSESSDNLKIINITVEEQPTGEISLGAGFGTQGGSIGGGISEKNFLGKGIDLNTNLEIDDNSLKGQFIYSKPNFAYTDNSLFTSIKSTTSDYMSDFGYKITNLGFSLATEFEQYENLFFKPEIDFTIEELETNNNSSASLKKQVGTYQDLYFNYRITHDLRNSKFDPSSGRVLSFNQEIPLYSDISEIVNNFIFTNYNIINKQNDMILRSSIFLKSANSLSSNKDTRVSKRVQLPSNRLRGFVMGKIGPIDNSEYVGGNYAAAVNLSTNLPFILKENDRIDFNYFIDFGNVWGVDYSKDIDDSNSLRSSTGIGANVLTPIGPLSFSYALPITKKNTDKTEAFRFNIGTTF